MKLKFIAILLVLAFAAASVGCIKFGPADPTAAPTEKATEAPTEEPTAAPTAAPEAELTFINNCGCYISEFYVSSSESEVWGESLGGIADGGSLSLSFDDIGGVPGGEFDVGALDSEFTNYDGYGIILDKYDSVELRPDGEGGFVYTVTHKDGSKEEHEAEVYNESDYTEDPDPISVYLESTHEYRSVEDRLNVHIDRTIAIPGESDKGHGALAQAMLERAELRETMAQEFVDENIEFGLHLIDDWQIGYDIVECAFEGTVRRADDRAVSIIYRRTDSNYIYSIDYYYADNFDTVTGRLLSLEDVLNDASVLPSLINEQLAAMADPRDPDSAPKLLDLDRDYSEYLSDPDCTDFAWTLDHDGLTLFFNINSEMFGDTGLACDSMFFSVFDYPELIKDKYRGRTYDYAVGVPKGCPCGFLMDGEVHTLFVNYFADTVYGEMNLYIEVDGRTIAVEGGYYYHEPVLFNMVDGCFLYIFGTEAEDGWEALSVYELTSGGAKLVDKYSAADCSWGYESEDADEGWMSSFIWEALTDPSNIWLSESFDLLGSMSGSRAYFVGVDGLPVAQDEEFFVNDMTLTFLRGITLTEVDFNGEAIGEKTVGKDTEVIVLRTDGESWCDFCLEDGSIVRGDIVLDWSEGDPTMNGVSLYELFGEDSIVFAG